MVVEYDKDVNAAYLRVKEGTIVHSAEVLNGIVCDFNDHGEVVGVEILALSQMSQKGVINDC